MRMNLFFLIFSLLMISSCQKNGCNSRQTVVVYTSIDQVFSEPILQMCAKKTGLRVKTVFDTEETKSTGVLNRLLAEAKNPQADIFWSGDPVRPFALIKRGLVQPYQSKIAQDIPKTFKDDKGYWTGFAARARVLLVNTKKVTLKEIHSIKDLIDPRWKGQTAIANPLYGTTTMHIGALFTLWGTKQAKQFMRSLKANKVRIASSNGEVKRLVVSGEVAFGLTDTDDAFEAQKKNPHIAIVYPDQKGIGTLLMPTTTILLKNSPHSSNGRRFLDCLFSKQVEQQMAKLAAHMPLRQGISLPKGIRDAKSIKFMKINYAQVNSMVEKIQPWLRKWVGH